ncbi:MAG: O-antigen ligase family protein [Coriobacteriia bacterium]|nr:O-antigen ligase family protein [Coriobacteriia bacterium]
MNNDNGTPTAQIANSMSKWFLVCTFICMAFITLMPNRDLFFIHNVWHIKVSIFVVDILAGGAFIYYRYRRRNMSDVSFKSLIMQSWPIFFFAAVNIGYLFWAYFHASAAPFGRVGNSKYWGNYLITLVALPASFTLGYLNRKNGEKYVPLFLFIVTAVSLAAGLFQAAAAMGYPNMVADGIRAMNKLTSSAIGVWNPGPSEPFRATGLETYPGYYAFPMIFIVAWTLSAKKAQRFRVTVFLMASAVILISGSRAALVGYLVVLIARGFQGIKSGKEGHGLRNRRALIALVSLAAVVLSIGIGYMTINNLGPFARPEVPQSEIKNVLAGGKSSENAASSILSTLSSGRTDLWAQIIPLIAQHPLGSGYQIAVVLNRAHAHNDFLNLWFWGGPFLVIPWIIVLVWLYGFTKKTSAPRLGGLIVFGTLGAGMFDVFFAGAPVMALALFLLGMMVIPKVGTEERSTEISSQVPFDSIPKERS